ncbi:alpha/beta hydrolase [Lichenihabitans sp. PAMC28606]|uniref:alpha/beta hydrolase fold domain-containing protein n=1 Tax=Lichenihabitans sp. PAMC28606 TaxID=2880932 RepID=UPI001D0BCF4E|nr:alpha/beta hydrolase fold domain-containing protein [Lichenihabitans sp. PAMC28606]UDL94076.1 alpha/beta hydrolase [Lichenihabitans sp. PAMC28606]
MGVSGQHRTISGFTRCRTGWYSRPGACLYGTDTCSARRARRRGSEASAARTQADTFVPDYRLAPNHPFPAAFLDP